MIFSPFFISGVKSGVNSLTFSSILRIFSLPFPLGGHEIIFTSPQKKLLKYLEFSESHCTFDSSIRNKEKNKIMKTFAKQAVTEITRMGYHALGNDAESVYPFDTEAEALTEEGEINSDAYAHALWAERNELEIERDQEAGVTLEDYEAWVYNAILDCAMESIA